MFFFPPSHWKSSYWTPIFIVVIEKLLIWFTNKNNLEYNYKFYPTYMYIYYIYIVIYTEESFILILVGLWKQHSINNYYFCCLFIQVHNFSVSLTLSCMNSVFLDFWEQPKIGPYRRTIIKKIDDLFLFKKRNFVKCLYSLTTNVEKGWIIFLWIATLKIGISHIIARLWLKHWTFSVYR